MLADDLGLKVFTGFKLRWASGRSHAIECEWCGVRGYGSPDDPVRNPHGLKYSWMRGHDEHVLCVCGKVVTKKGIGQHLSAKRRWGKACYERT